MKRRSSVTGCLAATRSAYFLKISFQGWYIERGQVINAYPENAQTGFAAPGWFFFKMGLYRDLMMQPMTIYVDEYRKKRLPDDVF